MGNELNLNFESHATPLLAGPPSALADTLSPVVLSSPCLGVQIDETGTLARGRWDAPTCFSTGLWN